MDCPALGLLPPCANSSRVDVRFSVVLLDYLLDYPVHGDRLAGGRPAPPEAAELVHYYLAFVGEQAGEGFCDEPPLKDLGRALLTVAHYVPELDSAPFSQLLDEGGLIGQYLRVNQLASVLVLVDHNE